MKKEAAYKRLVAYGLTPTTVSQLVAEIYKWVDRSGEEWTVARLKELRKLFQMRSAGCRYSPEWVATDRDGLPRGPFRRLFLMGRRGFILAYNALMVYSGFVYKGDLLLTAKQAKKFFAAVNRPRLDLASVALESEIVANTPLRLDVHRCRYDPIPLIEYPFSPSKRAPYGRVGGGPALEAAGDFDLPMFDQLSVSLQHLETYLKVFEGLHSDTTLALLDFAEDPSEVFPDEPSPAYSGKISFLQEPGYKARVVANPFVFQQAAVYGLGQSLFRLFGQVPQDCVFDQSKGALQVQEWLQQGLTVHCADLSSATDNLPLSGQLDYLIREGVPASELSLFEALSRGFWRIDSPHRLPGQVDLSSWYGAVGIQWTVGQPLGLLPSYPSAFLWHHAIMYWCYHQTGEPVRYVMVGDDVAMVGDRTFEVYSQVLNQLGVPVQPTKCMSSARAAEFVGRYLTPKSQVLTPKWRGDPSDWSFLDLASMLTVPRIYRLLRPRQKRVIRYVAPIPEPHGLGYNPEGRPWDERYLPWMDVLEEEVERVRDFRTSSSKIHRIIYGASQEMSYGWLLNGVTTRPGLVVDAPGHLVELQARGDLPVHLVVPNLLLLAEMQDVGTSRLDRAVLSLLSSVEKKTDVSTLVQWERRRVRAHRPVSCKTRVTRPG